MVKSWQSKLFSPVDKILQHDGSSAQYGIKDLDKSKQEENDSRFYLVFYHPTN